MSSTTTVPGGAATENPSRLDQWFGISRRGSSIAGEVRGGLVTFFTMAYILALNPLIIGTGADSKGNLVSGAPKYLDAAATQVDAAAVGQSIAMVAAATALIAGLLTILMGVVGRYPMALAAGLGLNAMVAYVIAPMSTWPQAMGFIFWEGVIITILVLTGFRDAVFRAVPKGLRTAISVGIGLFIALVGLVDGKIVNTGATIVSLGKSGTLSGWPVFVFVFGLFLAIALHARKVKGSFLISILITTVLAVIVEAVGKFGPFNAATGTGWALNVPALPKAESLTAPDLGLLGRVDIFGAFAIGGSLTAASVLTAVLLIFSLLLADFFDTMGTMVAIGTEGNLLDEQGEPEHMREILLVDSIGALAGGLASTSSNTSYVESTAGVADGARTGLASVVTGVVFLIAIFITPFVNMVPSEAVAPVLVMVGFLMMTQVKDIDWVDVELALPAFMTIIMMPFSYSITNGIGIGFITYVFVKLVRGKAREIHLLMWVVAALFVVYFVQGILAGWIAAL